jgi:hypothetical protein
VVLIVSLVTASEMSTLEAMVQLPELRPQCRPRENYISSADVRSVRNSIVQLDYMPTEEDVLRILGEATDALYSSEIATRLNRELASQEVFWPVDVVKLMRAMDEKIVQLSDGRWTLKQHVR